MKKKTKMISSILGATAIGAGLTIGATAQACGSTITPTPISNSDLELVRNTFEALNGNTGVPTTTNELTIYNAILSQIQTIDIGVSTLTQISVTNVSNSVFLNFDSSAILIPQGNFSATTTGGTLNNFENNVADLIFSEVTITNEIIAITGNVLGIREVANSAEEALIFNLRRLDRIGARPSGNAGMLWDAFESAARTLQNQNDLILGETVVPAAQGSISVTLDGSSITIPTNGIGLSFTNGSEIGGLGIENSGGSTVISGIVLNTRFNIISINGGITGLVAVDNLAVLQAGLGSFSTAISIPDAQTNPIANIFFLELGTLASLTDDPTGANDATINTILIGDPSMTLQYDVDEDGRRLVTFSMNNLTINAVPFGMTTAFNYINNLDTQPDDAVVITVNYGFNANTSTYTVAALNRQGGNLSRVPV